MEALLEHGELCHLLGNLYKTGFWSVKISGAKNKRKIIDGTCSSLTNQELYRPNETSSPGIPRIILALACDTIPCFFTWVLRNLNSDSCAYVHCTNRVISSAPTTYIYLHSGTCYSVSPSLALFFHSCYKITTSDQLFFSIHKWKGTHTVSYVWLIPINTMSLQLYSICYKT